MPALGAWAPPTGLIYRSRWWLGRGTRGGARREAAGAEHHYHHHHHDRRQTPTPQGRVRSDLKSWLQGLLLPRLAHCTSTQPRRPAWHGERGFPCWCETCRWMSGVLLCPLAQALPHARPGCPCLVQTQCGMMQHLAAAAHPGPCAGAPTAAAAVPQCRVRACVRPASSLPAGPRRCGPSLSAMARSGTSISPRCGALL
jgi:hypothetical protein